MILSKAKPKLEEDINEVKSQRKAWDWQSRQRYGNDEYSGSTLVQDENQTWFYSNSMMEAIIMTWR